MTTEPQDRRPRVLVGVDGSDCALLALDWAAAEARRRGAELDILYAYSWLAHAQGWEFAPPPEELEHGRDVVEHAAARARAAGSELDVVTEVVVDDPAVALVLAADRADLVVVGARGLGTVAGPLLGSVSQKVAELARVPVVVVRDVAPVPDGPVVLGIDPHGGAPEAVEHAFAEARRRGVSLLAVQGVQIQVDRNRLDEAYVTAVDTAVTGLQERTRERMTEWERRYPDVPVELRLVREHPVDALAAAAQEAALVVVGSRGQQGISGALLGSVSRGLLHRAPVVVVVRTPEPERRRGRRTPGAAADAGA